MNDKRFISSTLCCNPSIWVMGLVMGLFIFSCKKDGGPSWDVDVLAPVCHTQLGLNNLVADSLIQENADSSVKIVYSGTVYRVSLDTLVNIPDTNLIEQFYWPLGSIYMQPGNQIPFAGSLDETKYNLKTVELTKANIRSGDLIFKLKSTLQEGVQVLYQMPLATNNGTPFSISAFVPAGTKANPSTVSTTYDLSGYELDLRGTQGIDFNTMVASFSAHIDPNATDSLEISTGDYFEIKYEFSQIITAYAQGYFGQHFIKPGIQSDTLALFQKIAGGTFDIESINMALQVENGFGVDAKIVIDTIMGTNTGTGTSVLFDHPTIGSSINLTRALNHPSLGYPFSYSQNTIVMDGLNSNAETFIENLPHILDHGFRIVVNPMGNNSNGNDFLFYESDLKINLDLEHPASFGMDNLTFADTVDFDMGLEPGEENQQVTGNLLVYAYNGFPVEAMLQIYLYNDAYVVIDSLVLPTANTIAAAPVNNQLKVTDPRLSTVIIPISQLVIDNLTAAKKALVKVSFTTQPVNQTLKIYSDYNVDIKVVADLQYRLKTN